MTKCCSSTLPSNLCLRSTGLSAGGYGVWSVKDIPVRTRFGPYQGIFIDPTNYDSKKGFQWQVETKDKKIMVLDGSYEKNSNWLRYVNYACNREHQNLVSIQNKSGVYYLTSKSIPANTELLVWYQDKVVQDRKRQRKGYSSNDVHGSDNPIRNSHNQKVAGYSKNEIRNAEIIELDGTKIIQIGIVQNKRKSTHIKDEEQDVETENNITSKTSVKKIDKYQKMCIFTKFHKQLINRENISIHKKQAQQKHFEATKKKNYHNSKFRESNVLHLYEHSDIGKKVHSNILRNRFIKHLKLKSHEQAFENDASKMKFSSSKRLLMSKRCTLENSNSNGNNSIYSREPNVPTQNNTRKKCYKSNKCKEKLVQGNLILCKEKITGKLNKCKVFVKKSRNWHLKENEMVNESKQPYECTLCDTKFALRRSLTRHQKIHTGEKPFICNVCGWRFAHNYSLVMHKVTHTGERPYKCKFCQNKFARKTNLRRHERTHTGERPHKCNRCGKKFITRTGLKDHEKIHTGEKPHECNVCNKKFITTSRLKEHKRIHTGEKPYHCIECGKKFAHRSTLVGHKRTHTGEMPYKCNICEKKFNAYSTLYTHVRIHTGEKPYECDVCKKTFVTSSARKVHKRIHTGEKPYKCNVCQKNFSRISSLIMHRKIHTGEKPYKCNTCEKGYIQKSLLKDHELRHAGEKTYKCNVCKKKFVTRSDLRIHIKIHFNKKLFECITCKKTFTHPHSLTNHKKIHKSPYE